MRDTKQKGIILPKCRRSARCCREHCHICLRLFRINLVRQAGMLGLHCDEKHWQMLTLTPNDQPIPKGELSQTNQQKEVKKHLKRLERHLPNVLVIGGLDIALKYEGNEPIGWQPHLHLLIYGISRQASLKALRAAYPKSEYSPKPIRHEHIKGGSFYEALTYCYKSLYFPRGSGSQVREGKKRGGLPRQYELELRAYLAKWPIGKRMVLRYAKFHGPTNKTKRRLLLKPPYDKEFEKLSSPQRKNSANRCNVATHKRINRAGRAKVRV